MTVHLSARAMQNFGDAQRLEAYSKLLGGNPVDLRAGEMAFANATEAARQDAIKLCGFFKNMVFYHMWEIEGYPQGSDNAGEVAYNNPQVPIAKKDEAVRRAWYDYTEDCAICLRPLISGERSRAVTADGNGNPIHAGADACNHVFHKACCLENLQRRPECSLCRRVIAYATN